VAQPVFGVKIRCGPFVRRIFTIAEHGASVARQILSLTQNRALMPDRVLTIAEQWTFVILPAATLPAPLGRLAHCDEMLPTRPVSSATRFWTAAIGPGMAFEGLTM
jgi:hypothetical protein